MFDTAVSLGNSDVEGVAATVGSTVGSAIGALPDPEAATWGTRNNGGE